MNKRMLRGALIAAVYTALGLAPGLSAISFGPLQFRVAESLTVLPILYIEAIPGLFIGVLLVNLFGSPLGPLDVVLGSLATLLAAYLTYRLRKTIWAYWPPVIVNAIVVSIVLHLTLELEWPYLVTVLFIGISQAAVVFTLGKLLIKKLRVHAENETLRR